MAKKMLTDRRKSIYLFLLIFVVYSLIYMTKNCYSAAMTTIVNQGIMTKSQTGLIAALFYLLYAPFQIVGGIAADRFSPAKLILFGTLGAGVCNLLVFFFSENYIAMIIIWSLNAVIQFGIWPSIFKISVAELKSDMRTRGVFYINFTPSIGLALSYITAAFITDWKMNFLVSAIILFVSVVVFYFAYGSIEKSMVPAENPVASTKNTKKADTGIVLAVIKSGVPLLLIVYVVQGILGAGLKAIAPVMLMESYEAITPTLANVLNIILVASGPIGLVLSRLPFFKKKNYALVISVLFLISIPMLVIVLFVGSANAAIVIGALFLLTTAMSTTSMFFAFISKTFEFFGCAGALSGLFNCMAAISLVLANYVFTSVAENFGWGVTTKSWLVICIISLVLALISVPIWKRFTSKLGAKED